jgi:hypothetical protein
MFGGIECFCHGLGGCSGLKVLFFGFLAKHLVDFVIIFFVWIEDEEVEGEVMF